MKRLTVLLAVAVSVAAPALAGPPWITIEVRPTGGAFVFARTFHHGTPQGMALTGTAEGLVDGQRRSVPLSFERTGESNVFGVPKTWTDGGVWVLNIGTDEDHGGAGVVVGVDRAGTAAFVRFPRSYQGASRIATRGEINALLRALDASQPPPALGGIGFMGILRLGLPPLVLVLLATLAAKALVRVVRWARRREVRAAVA